MTSRTVLFLKSSGPVPDGKASTTSGGASNSSSVGASGRAIGVDGARHTPRQTLLLCWGLLLGLLWSSPLSAQMQPLREPLQSLTPATPTLRSADLDVLLTRALASLQLGAYEEALKDSQRALTHLEGPSPSWVLAHYLHGIACARLKRFEAAALSLEQVLHSEAVALYPQLALELGLVKLQLGQRTEGLALLELAARLPETADEAQQLLSQQRAQPSDRAWALEVGLATGYDQNPGGAPRQHPLDCAPGMLGDEPLNPSCGAFVQTHLEARAGQTQSSYRLQARYRLQHRGYLAASLEPFQELRQRLQLQLRLLPALHTTVELQSARAGTSWMPASRLGLAGLRWTPTTLTFFELHYEGGYEWLADLPSIWGVTFSQELPCDGSVPGLSCTAQQQGPRQRLRASLFTPPARVRGRLEALVLAQHAQDPRFTGAGAALRWAVELNLSAQRRLNVALDGQTLQLRDWYVLTYGFQVQARQGLALPGQSAGLSRPLALTASLGAGETAVQSEEGAVEPRRYRRWVGLLELSYAF